MKSLRRFSLICSLSFTVNLVFWQDVSALTITTQQAMNSRRALFIILRQQPHPAYRSWSIALLTNQLPSVLFLLPCLRVILQSEQLGVRFSIALSEPHDLLHHSAVSNSNDLRFLNIFITTTMIACLIYFTIILECQKGRRGSTYQLLSILLFLQNFQNLFRSVGFFNNIFEMVLSQLSLCLFLIAIATAATDDGFSRLSTLHNRSLSNESRVIRFSTADFEQYVMKYPRPYDIVIFFTASQYQLCKELLPKYEYLAKLYERAGQIDNPKNPTFFVLMEFAQNRPIFKTFSFETVPNIVVSQPHMAIITDPRQKADYYREFTWKITPSDNEVTTDKMLEYVNKKVNKNVVFQLPAETIQTWTLYFVIGAVCASIVYTQLKTVWNHWVFWFICSAAIYLTCQSGIVYCILHDITWKTHGQAGIFSGGSREQTMQEGFFVSGIIITISMMLILVGVLGRKCSHKFSSIVCIFALLLVYVGVSYLENAYKQKGWYGPSFRPPEHYLKGPLKIDQGNSI